MMLFLMNVLFISFLLEKCGVVMGIFGLVMIFVLVIGFILLGWLIEYYEWRMLFYFVMLIVVIVLIGVFFLLKDKKEKVEINLDFLFFLLFIIGFGGFLYGFSLVGDKGWDFVEVYGIIIVGVVVLILFIMC